jgi:hypothetical protein
MSVTNAILIGISTGSPVLRVKTIRKKTMHVIGYPLLNILSLSNSLHANRLINVCLYHVVKNLGKILF